MERKIGEIFKYNGEWYQCLPEICICNDCAFKNDITCKTSKEIRGECQRASRQDGVIFKKLEKVGEPYMLEDKKFQKYKVFKTPYIYHKIDCSWQSFADPYYISLEIKQTKENMEDNKKQTSLISTKGIYEKFKGKTVQCLVNSKDGDLVNGYGIVCGYTDRYLIIGFTNGYEGCIKSFTDNVFLENRDFLSYRFWNISHVDDKPFIKPFNLEAARSGKPVCTRDGRKARIIYFDAKGAYPIVALIETGNGEKVVQYMIDGHCTDIISQCCDDLMMLPEKKEGWINIYDADTTFRYVDGRVYETKDEAIQKAKEEVEKEQREKNEYIDTIRVEWEE